ncbi:hypothetical protein [Roseobacter sp.]|uniref:hypothetical protein n=1 Tax=Roseobacter sp. TaxID=1907202 RepID=UPI0032995F42
MRIILISAALVFANEAAADAYWDYKDWTVSISDIDTGQDLRRTCRASTGGDGLPSVSITTSNGDVGPPYDYPVPLFRETAPRGYATQIQTGDYIVYEFDDGQGAEATLEMGYEEDVFPFAHASPFPGEVDWMLGRMLAAQSVTFYRVNETLPAHQDGSIGREVVYTASLSGFTAAYLKMMESCGHVPGDIIG